MSKFKRLLSLFLSAMMIVTTIMSTGVIAHASDSVEPFSLLPLEEVKAYLVLNDYPEEDIKAMPLEKVLSLMQDSNGNYIEIPETAQVVWAHFKDDEGNIIRDEYHVLGREETVDLTEFEYTTGYSMELIVGSGNQLDPGNIRYIVRVYITNTVSEKIDYQLYKQGQDGTRTKVEPKRIHTDTNTQLPELPITTVGYMVPDHQNGTEYYFGMSSLASEHPNVNTDVYTFDEFVKYLSGSESTPITDKILNQNMQDTDAGYKGVFDAPTSAYDTKNMFALVYTEKTTGRLMNYSIISFFVKEDMSYITGAMFAYENGELVDNTSLDVDSSEIKDLDIDFGDGSVSGYDAIEGKYFMLKEGYSADEEYYFSLDAHSSIWTDDANSHVVKAVVGHYDSLADADGQADIKDQLIPVDRTSTPYGYKANYNYKNKGMNFTVFFDDNTVFKFNVRVMEYDPKYDSAYMPDFDSAPIVGAKDPWFRVNGTIDQDNKSVDAYVVENGKAINMDTLYGYGYQTILINDKDVDLSQLKPTFWFGNADRVETYVGSKQESGVSVQDFSKGSVQYSTIIDNHVKNYNVNFVKKESGPKLFVNGPSTRAVFLDEYFEYKHDILIANVGDQPLTDLKVTLDAKNVKLDDYWTVGGTNNDTLAAFTTTEDTSDYGELANIAKIRLLPDGDGEVEGTLTISAKDQEDVVIQLTGRAANPKIITSKLDDAVKYVPYSYVVSTDNMNDWNSVTFSIESGKLPEGLELYPTTGEIYGVPQETGTFKIRVKATYGREDYFEPSYADLTLTVKENTDENVYLASDINKGYSIKQPIGTQTGDYSFELNEIADTVFTSNGEYGEFVGLWLNGELLEPGVDYDSESGSTKITIKSQTFENRADKDGTNTIAMEFRKDTNGDGKGDSGAEMNRTSQNFTINREPSQAEKDQEAANKVISLIKSIPSTVTLNDKQTINSARTAYNALTSAQQQLVTNYDRLIRAEAAIKQLEENEKDKAAANKVVNLIDALPNPITLDSENAVNEARNAYSMLTASQKRYVTNYSKLQDAEKTISELKLNDENATPFVTFVGLLSDKNGKALSDYIVEIHSDVKTSKTDENGSFLFNTIEFGSHTMLIKDASGNVVAQKKFNIVDGTPLALNGDEIVAENGETFTLHIQLDGSSISFLSIEKGNKAPTIDTDHDDDGIYIGDDNIKVPNTGDDTNLLFWYIVLFGSLAVLAGTCLNVKNNRAAKHYSA